MYTKGMGRTQSPFSDWQISLPEAKALDSVHRRSLVHCFFLQWETKLQTTIQFIWSYKALQTNMNCILKRPLVDMGWEQSWNRLAKDRDMIRGPFRSPLSKLWLTFDKRRHDLSKYKIRLLIRSTWKPRSLNCRVHCKLSSWRADGHHWRGHLEEGSCALGRTVGGENGKESFLPNCLLSGRDEEGLFAVFLSSMSATSFWPHQPHHPTFPNMFE